jgi:hypothetical protein
MPTLVRFVWQKRWVQALALAFTLVLTTTLVAAAAVPIIQISSDPFTNTDSQHKTQVEPDTFAWGSTIVVVTQTGRYSDGGSSDIGYATSTDGGNTWTHDFLNCVTNKKANNCGSLHVYDRASDPSVAYDPKHNVWMVASLVLTSASGAGVEVSRSTDGGLTFANPVVVDIRNTFHDKSWIACDTNSNSPYYGNCYVEWDDVNLGDLIQMQVSTDGGLTWSATRTPAGSPCGLGGQPVAQPNGTVVVPYADCFYGSIRAFTSTDGGNSWGSSVTVGSINFANIINGIRNPPLPSAEIDGDGKVYVAWSDCRFRSGCSADDIVISTSTNGTSWTSPARVPFVPTTSQSDIFTPGIAVDPNSHAPNVRVAVTAYATQVANCSPSTCKLFVGIIGTGNSGKTWTKTALLAGPMTVTWLANTNQGYMYGDYISTSFLPGGKAFPGFEVAQAPSGGLLNESLYSVQGGLPLGPGEISTAGEHPVAHSNRPHPTKPVNTIQPIQY